MSGSSRLKGEVTQPAGWRERARLSSNNRKSADVTQNTRFYFSFKLSVVEPAGFGTVGSLKIWITRTHCLLIINASVSGPIFSDLDLWIIRKCFLMFVFLLL